MVAKHVVRYLKGTVDYGIKYDVTQNINLHSYVDSDWEVVPLIVRVFQVTTLVWDMA